MGDECPGHCSRSSAFKGGWILWEVRLFPRFDMNTGQTTQSFHSGRCRSNWRFDPHNHGHMWIVDVQFLGGIIRADILIENLRFFPFPKLRMPVPQSSRAFFSKFVHSTFPRIFNLKSTATCLKLLRTTHYVLACPPPPSSCHSHYKHHHNHQLVFRIDIFLNLLPSTTAYYFPWNKIITPVFFFPFCFLKGFPPPKQHPGPRNEGNALPTIPGWIWSLPEVGSRDSTERLIQIE